MSKFDNVLLFSRRRWHRAPQKVRMTFNIFFSARLLSKTKVQPQSTDSDDFLHKRRRMADVSVQLVVSNVAFFGLWYRVDWSVLSSFFVVCLASVGISWPLSKVCFFSIFVDCAGRTEKSLCCEREATFQNSGRSFIELSSFSTHSLFESSFAPWYRCKPPRKKLLELGLYCTFPCRFDCVDEYM